MPTPAIPAIDLIDALPTERTLTAADIPDLAAELAAYHAHFAPLFRRSEQRVWADVYLRGLLTADVPRKNIEAIALRLFGAEDRAGRTVRALQQFVGEGGWDDAAILAAHQRLVKETLGEDDGVLIIDGSDFPKQGQHSAGVARQWCGHSGKKDNCQAGVFLGYASRKGYTLLDRRLYLPACWFTADYARRWQACRIPNDTPFRTKHELAAELVEQAHTQQQIQARWVVCDEGYGDDPATLDRFAATGLWYLAEIPRDTQVWPLVEPDGHTPRPRPTRWVPPQKPSRKGFAPRRERVHPDSPAKCPLDQYAAQIPPECWQRYRVLEGSKGPLVADFAAVRAVAVRNKLPGPEVWVLFRRKVDPASADPELKVYLSCAPSETSLDALVRVSGMRWPIEACFAEGNGELGLDHYELRFWRGWHHHMTMVILAHHFLVRLQKRLNQREGDPQAARLALAGRRDGAPDGSVCRQARVDVAPSHEQGAEPRRGALTPDHRSPSSSCRPARGVGLAGLPAQPQSRRLSVPSQTHPRASEPAA
jgi:SRSO17 transposase